MRQSEKKRMYLMSVSMIWLGHINKCQVPTIEGKTPLWQARLCQCVGCVCARTHLEALLLIKPHGQVCWLQSGMCSLATPALVLCCLGVSFMKHSLCRKQTKNTNMVFGIVFEQQHETDPLLSKDPCQKGEKLLKTINSSLLCLTFAT